MLSDTPGLKGNSYQEATRAALTIMQGTCRSVINEVHSETGVILGQINAISRIRARGGIGFMLRSAANKLHLAGNTMKGCSDVLSD